MGAALGVRAVFSIRGSLKYKLRLVVAEEAGVFVAGYVVGLENGSTASEREFRGCHVYRVMPERQMIESGRGHRVELLWFQIDVLLMVSVQQQNHTSNGCECSNSMAKYNVMRIIGPSKNAILLYDFDITP